MKRLLVCFFALCAPSAAQIVPTVNLYTTYTDNLFLSASKRGDLINAAYIDLDYISSADLGLYYSAAPMSSATTPPSLAICTRWD